MWGVLFWLCLASPAPAVEIDPSTIYNNWCDTTNPTIPSVKCTVRLMDDQLNNHTFDYDKWQVSMKGFWVQDGRPSKDGMVYITNWTPFQGSGAGGKKCLNTCYDLRDWFHCEHVPWNTAFARHSFNQMLFIGEEFPGQDIPGMASTTTYANLEWDQASGDICGIEFAAGPPSKKPKRGMARIFDFYHLKYENNEKLMRIQTNWMLLDIPLLMMQANDGVSVVPRAKTARDGDLVLLPRANDGVPAPTWYAHALEAAEKASVKEVAERALKKALGIHGGAMGTVDDADACVAYLYPLFAPNLQFSGCLGVGVSTTLEEFCSHVRRPLLKAITGPRSFDMDVLVCEQRYCGIHGHLRGNRSRDHPWLDEALPGPGPSGSSGAGRLRLGIHTRVNEDLKVEDMWLLADIPKWYADAGENLWERLARAPGSMVAAQAPEVVIYQ